MLGGPWPKTPVVRFYFTTFKLLPLADLQISEFIALCFSSATLLFLIFLEQEVCCSPGQLATQQNFPWNQGLKNQAMNAPRGTVPILWGTREDESQDSG